MKVKVLLVYNKVWPYRVKIFDLLNQWVDLTVGFSDPSFVGKQYSFNTVFLPIKSFGPFEFHSKLTKHFNEFDVLVFLFNIRSLSLMRYSLNPFRKKPVVLWGIGVRASYENKFDSKNFWDRFRYLMSRKTEATVFYSAYPLDQYLNAGIERRKLFVANNTVEVFQAPSIDFNIKKNFIFIGTLYSQKGLEVLLDAYLRLYKTDINCPNLDIIGDGPEASRIRTFILSHGLDQKVTMHGSVFDLKSLSVHFETAMACISPNQAGLSVLTSMGNGTIFVTKEDAITGGELFNILHGKNGIIYKDGTDVLFSQLSWISNNRESVLSMCKEAYKYYWAFRTPHQMASSLYDAIMYSLEEKIYS